MPAHHINSVKDGVLSVQGRFWGRVDGVTTGMLDANTPTDDMVQSAGATINGAGARKLRELSADLNYALVRLCLDLPQPGGYGHGAKLVSYLTRPEGIQVMRSHNHNLLRKWLAANSLFKIAGTTLVEWTSTFPDKMDKHMRLLKQNPSFKHKPTLEEELHRYMSDVEAALSVGMRLVITDEGHIGMAHPQTRRCDYICSKGVAPRMILGFAVVLRPEEGTQGWHSIYIDHVVACRVVGEASVAMDRDKAERSPEVTLAIH